MSPGWIEGLGWLATAVFVGSYFFARPALLRCVQMGGALLWVAYGVLIHATPVIVANVLVFSAAALTAARAVKQPAGARELGREIPESV